MNNQELVEKMFRLSLDGTYYDEDNQADALSRECIMEIISLCRQHFRTATLDEVSKAMADTVANMSDNQQRHQSIIQPMFKVIDNLRGESDEYPESITQPTHFRDY